MSEYQNKYLDSTGIRYLWNKALGLFVRKDGNKVLSDNNYTDEDKARLAELSESASDWESMTNTPTTLAGYGITDAASKDDLLALKDDVSKVYKYKGSVETAAELENITDPVNGDVYDVAEDGTNYAWNADEGRWDPLGTLIRIETLTNNELDIITGSATSAEVLATILADGGNVDIGEDITLEQNMTVTKDTVLNLGGHTLSSTQSGYALTAQGAKLTIENGNIESAGRIAQATNGGEIVVKSGSYTSGDVGFASVGSGSKITFDDGTITSQEGGIGSFDGAEIEINGGKIEGKDNFAIFTNGSNGRGGNTITMNGGELTGNIESNGYEAIGVYIANNDTFTMNGGSILAKNGAGLLMRAGTVTINDGEIVSTGTAGTTGWIGDNKTKMSKSAVIYHESANYPGKAGMSLTINGGKFIGVDHSVEILSNEDEPKVAINGGEFSPAID